MPQDNLGAPHTMTPPCHPTSCNIPYNRNVTVPTMRSHQNQHSMKLYSSRTTFASKKAQMCHQLALFGQSAVPFGLPGIQLLRNRKLLRELVQLFHKGCLAGCTLPAKLSWDLGIGPKSKANSLLKKNITYIINYNYYSLTSLKNTTKLTNLVKPEEPMVPLVLCFSAHGFWPLSWSQAEWKLSVTPLVVSQGNGNLLTPAGTREG